MQAHSIMRFTLVTLCKAQELQIVPLSQEIKVAALVILEEKLCEVYTKEAESHNAHALDNAQ